MHFLLQVADLHDVAGASIITDTLRAARGLMFWSLKEAMLSQRLVETGTAKRQRGELRLDRFAANELKESGGVDSGGDSSVFGQAFQQASKWEAAAFRLGRGVRAWIVRPCQRVVNDAL